MQELQWAYCDEFYWTSMWTNSKKIEWKLQYMMQRNKLVSKLLY